MADQLPWLVQNIVSNMTDKIREILWHPKNAMQIPSIIYWIF